MLNVLDEFTHECLAIRVARKLKAIDVIDVLSDLFILQGKNGYIESFNARLRDELLDGEIFYTLREAVRGDSHFATPEVMDLLEDKRCGYIFGLSINTRLIEIGRPWSEDVATRRALSKTQKMRRFFQTSYAAVSWSKPRKVVAVSRRASKAATHASSSPTCQGGQKSSTKRSTARADAWRISSRT
jgi:Transposase DDE domain group 1